MKRLFTNNLINNYTKNLHPNHLSYFQKQWEGLGMMLANSQFVISNGKRKFFLHQQITSIH
jgi:hypothetical protein